MTQFYWTSQIKCNKTIIKQTLKIYWTVEKIHAIKYQADNLKTIKLSYKWMAIRNKVLLIKMENRMIWVSSAKIIKLEMKRGIYLIMLSKAWLLIRILKSKHLSFAENF